MVLVNENPFDDEIEKVDGHKNFLDYISTSDCPIVLSVSRGKGFTMKRAQSSVYAFGGETLR